LPCILLVLQNYYCELYRKTVGEGLGYEVSLSTSADTSSTSVKGERQNPFDLIKG
jgi:hypothetical protein